MNRVLKNGLILGSAGFVLGLIIGITIFISSGGGELDAVTIFYFLVGGIYGGLAMGSSALYDIENWSILRCTATHFSITLIGFYILGTVQGGWLVIGSAFFWIATAAFVAMYFLIWMIQYLKYKKEVEKMNMELKEFKRRESQEAGLKKNALQNPLKH